MPPPVTMLLSRPMVTSKLRVMIIWVAPSMVVADLRGRFASHARCPNRSRCKAPDRIHEPRNLDKLSSARDSNTTVVLLCGGDKRQQERDIARALELAQEI